MTLLAPAPLVSATLAMSEMGGRVTRLWGSAAGSDVVGDGVVMGGSWPGADCCDCDVGSGDDLVVTLAAPMLGNTGILAAGVVSALLS